jgi:hypothetical protein
MSHLPLLRIVDCHQLAEGYLRVVKPRRGFISEPDALPRACDSSTYERCQFTVVGRLPNDRYVVEEPAR